MSKLRQIFTDTLSMSVYNYVEDLVFNKINEILSARKGVCRCDRCVSDMMAMAISGLPVVPYVTSEGGIYREVQNMTNDRLKVDVASRCIRAVEHVCRNLRHGNHK